MEIYILRHGNAEDHNAAGDAQRAHTEEGRRKLRRVLDRGSKAKVAPSLILSSPYVRARQTAEMAALILRCGRKIVETEALLPEGSPEELWEEIRARRQESGILIAGHEPMLSATTAWLLGAPAVQVDMKKGALARVDVDHFGPKPQGILRFLLTPRLAGAD
jgi:phosphohistidine phosphatase